MPRITATTDSPSRISVKSVWHRQVSSCGLERLQIARGGANVLTSAQRQILETAITRIVEGYAAGTRFGIRMDRDGLLSAGVAGQQLTWMDARVGNRVITPRIGKPVEVQALWLNALWIAGHLNPKWRIRRRAIRCTTREPCGRG